MKCPNCGLSSWKIINYNSYIDELVYKCNCCGETFSSHKNNDTITTNKDITNYNDYYVNYDEIYKNNQIQSNFPPNEIKEIKIIADKITIAEKSVGITIDLSDKNCFDKVDSIVIKGIKYIKE